MNTKLHVGNIAATATQDELRVLFLPFGNVAEVQLPIDRENGRPCGFAIVTMATPQGARAALLGLNGNGMDQRVLTVTEHVGAKRVLPAPGKRQPARERESQ